MKRILVVMQIVCLFTILTGCLLNSSRNEISSKKIVSSETLLNEGVSREGNENVEYINLLKNVIFNHDEDREYKYNMNYYCFLYDIDYDNTPELFLGVNGKDDDCYNIYDFENKSVVKYGGNINDEFLGDNFFDNTPISEKGYGKPKGSIFGGLEIYSTENKKMVKSLTFFYPGIYPLYELHSHYYDISNNSVNQIAGVTYTWIGEDENPDNWGVGTSLDDLKESTQKEYDEYCKQLTDGLEYEYVPFVKIEKILEGSNLENGLKKAYAEYQERMS